MSQTLPAFQQFQMAFGRRCRDPRAARPAGVPARRMKVYEELLFNNLTGFLDACFPVCRAVIGDTRWRRLNRNFFRVWRSQAPLFREIPHEFVCFLTSTKFALPAFFRELAHYEWTELAVDTSNLPCPPHDPAGDLMRGKPLANPCLMNLSYAWPVHRISPTYRPRKPARTHLLVFRNAADDVKFVEINDITARLIERIVAHEESGHAAIQQLAGQLPAPLATAVLCHGPHILDDLRRQGVILGVKA